MLLPPGLGGRGGKKMPSCPTTCPTTNSCAPCPEKKVDLTSSGRGVIIATIVMGEVSDRAPGAMSAPSLSMTSGGVCLVRQAFENHRNSAPICPPALHPASCITPPPPPHSLTIPLFSAQLQTLSFSSPIHPFLMLLPGGSKPADLEEEAKIRVLLVDDHEAFRRVATDFLQRHNELIVVGVAHGGEEALAQAPNLEPEVILVDLNMPGMSGIETIRRLRAMLPQVGIIALTLLDPKRYRKAVLAAGADDLVAKANLNTDLRPAIRRVVQAERSGQEPTD
jgi:CheY-like chemotaxis protein